MSNGAKILTCSFCFKSEQEVRKLIATSQCAICDGCVGLCQEILREEALNAAVRAATESDGETPDAASHKNHPTFYCSFCGKSQHEVAKLIAGPTVFICGGCVELRAGLVDETAGARPGEPDAY